MPSELHNQYTAALKLLTPNWDALSASRQAGQRDSLMWSVDAAVEAGIVQWPEPKSQKEPRP